MTLALPLNGRGLGFAVALSFPRRRESMGRIGLRLGLGLQEGLVLRRHGGFCTRSMDSRLRGNDTRGCIMRMLCGPAYV